MKTHQPLLTTSILAAAAITKNRFVTLGGGVPAAGAWCPGVAELDCDIGLQASVNTHGLVLVTAGAAVAAGAQVETDNQGRAITLAAGAALGRAMDAAGAAGDLIRVKL